jgi:hypothetical protein
MRFIRQSSYDEFVEWYLRREQRKGTIAEVPALAEKRVQLFERPPVDKIGDLLWLFRAADWYVISLDSREEFDRLVYLDVEWTRSKGLIDPAHGKNFRLLRQVARNALHKHYLEKPDASKHREYYEKFGAGLRLCGDDRLTLRTMRPVEHDMNPAGIRYLHDGAGRGLPYMLRVLEGMPYEPVEAFVAEEA